MPILVQIHAVQVKTEATVECLHGAVEGQRDNRLSRDLDVNPERVEVFHQGQLLAALAHHKDVLDLGVFERRVVH